MIRTFAAMAIYSVFTLPGLVLAQSGMTTVKLEQIHFIINSDETNMCEHLIFKNIDDGIVPSAQISTQIINRLSSLCGMIIPRFSARDVAAKSLLGFLIGMPNMTPHGSIGLGTSSFQGLENPESFPWVQALSISNVVISADDLSRVFYLEVIDRLAQFFDLRTGVLPSGELIYGTHGNWPTNNVPAYTLELDERYGE